MGAGAPAAVIKAFGRALLRLTFVILAVLLPIAIGFAQFTANLPEPTADQSRTDAIVVLTGGGDRISTGLALLEAGKAQRLFVSGVHPGVDVAELLKVDRTDQGSALPAPAVVSRIDLGDTAGDTFGNAVETVDWMRANHFRSMRLVTADYHIRRALIEFRMAAPDLVIIPNPVRPPRVDTQHWWHDGSAFGVLLNEYGKYLIAKWRYALSRALDKL
jgi:uncharacterized SAM-binding protein YcdF (DUF218 family)